MVYFHLSEKFGTHKLTEGCRELPWTMDNHCMQNGSVITCNKDIIIMYKLSPPFTCVF